ncbi:hypothetical protein MSG28_006144 [Choristoneura fumiferana]|uniref:Uncharacterized protein n=1 Tax=Choristoneura fumiferana TaxID=7141 RepID=A0ACC0JDQ9_CHOFU|nr:hypothetical protein MSG28_006144 [Choristoneura fumiferana]
MECPNENITTNQDSPHQVFALNSDSISSAPWVEDAPIKILIHGYTGHRDFSPSTEIRPAYMRCCDYNIISVDYNPIAREPCYFQAARNTELVGKCTAQLIDQLVTQHGFELQRFHVIGFSLGGQTAGFIGNYVTSGKLERISALDPAMPLFVSQDNKKKVDATKSGCDHARAPAYYAESIITEVGFYATKCTSWITHMIGWCNYVSSDEEVLFGEYMPHNISGLYFFATNSKSPYARGRNKKQSRRSLFTL